MSEDPQADHHQTFKYEADHEHRDDESQVLPALNELDDVEKQQKGLKEQEYFKRGKAGILRQ